MILSASFSPFFISDSSIVDLYSRFPFIEYLYPIRSSKKLNIFYSKLFQMPTGRRGRVRVEFVAECRKSPLKPTEVAYFPKYLFPFIEYLYPIRSSQKLNIFYSKGLRP